LFRTGSSTTARTIRSAAARLALVAALAGALLVGALALGPHREAAAVYNCAQIYALAEFNLTMGDVFSAYGRHDKAEMAYETSSAWFAYADARGC
jgi:hypothetical protein